MNEFGNFEHPICKIPQKTVDAIRPYLRILPHDLRSHPVCTPSRSGILTSAIAVDWPTERAHIQNYERAEGTSA